MITRQNIHMQTTPAPDLMAAHALAYAPCGFTLNALAAEPESADYGACALVLNGLRIRFRVAKTTPIKTGQFVTLWKRTGEGPIQPFELSDPVDTFVVSTRSGPHFGQFVFPKAVLAAKDVVAQSGQGGKTGHSRLPTVGPRDQPPGAEHADLAGRLLCGPVGGEAGGFGTGAGTIYA